jgi:hypothetical protein
VQNVEAATAHYIIADRPLSEAEWIEQRTKLIDATQPQRVPDTSHDTEI